MSETIATRIEAHRVFLSTDGHYAAYSRVRSQGSSTFADRGSRYGARRGTDHLAAKQ
jgi:hypothetical protein